MLKFGIISEVDAAKGLARVHFDQEDFVSGWLPVSVPMTYKDQFQFPLNVNQHVYCIMDDQCINGVIAGAIYDSGNLPEDGDASKVRVRFVQGLSLEYDRNSKTLSIKGTGKVDVDVDGEITVKGSKVSVTALQSVEITAPQTTVKGPLTVEAGLIAATIATSGGGAITSDGDISTTGTISGATVKQGTVNLGTHTHSGVTTGGGTSGPPIP